MKIIKTLFLLWLFPLFLFAQLNEITSNHSELEWRSFETEHFAFYYHQGTERTAFLASKIIEDIYPAITGLYDYEPQDRIHVIIKDTDDYANGAAYFFNNKMEIWTTNLDYVMRGTKNWMRDVITHEFTHMVSIQKTVKSNLTMPFGFFQWFGYEDERRKDVVRGFPNTLVSYPLSSISMPVWFAEGVAQLQSDDARFDYRDPHREMIIRDRLLSERFLTYNEMAIFAKSSHGNESSYNLGFSFAKYLTERFGDSILEKITKISSKWSSYTFDGVLKSATGIVADTLYNDWKNELTERYLNQTKSIRSNEIKGQLIEKKGYANLYPVFAPDGKSVAWSSNKESDFFAPAHLYIQNLKDGSKRKVANNISSSLSWSKNGRYIAYARKELNQFNSNFNDLFLYDVEKDEEIRLTYNLRGNNPDFNFDDTKLSFVTTTNGLHQLNVLHLPENIENKSTQTVWFDMEEGTLYSSEKEGRHLRKVRYRGQKIEQLLAFKDGRQIYHPRWAKGDSALVFDTSVEYGRNIGQYNFKTNSFSMLLTAEEELRYPSFSRDGQWLYYSASSTGIYNLFRRNLHTGQTEQLTNVTGGAFMPAVDEAGNIVYALYENVGYKLAKINTPKTVKPNLAVYDPRYPDLIPDLNFNDTVLPKPETQKYKQTFANAHIIPRLFVDYGTIKVGGYFVLSDVLDQINAMGAVAVNSDFEYDLYGNVNYTALGPTISLELFNVNANITDTVTVERGYTAKAVRGVNFNLTQFGIGLKDFTFFKGSKMSLGYVGQRYNAKLDGFLITPPPGLGQPENYSSIRYSYLKGHSFITKLSYNLLEPRLYSDIAPSNGFYLYAAYSHDVMDFLDGFNTSGEKQIGLENFNTHVYNTFELNGEAYFENPLFEDHALGLHFKTALIDRPVPDFFNYFGGGIFGLRGYPFYSIDGRKKLIGSLSYRFPLHRHMDLKLGHLQFDKLFMGLFADYGNVFNSRKIDLDDFKRDVGVELRLQAFSYNMFPTNIFFQAAWPLDEAINYDKSAEKNVTYPQEWRFYFGILFEFDLRDQTNNFINGHSLNNLKFW